MKHLFKSMTALLMAVLLFALVLPASAVGTMDYNSHDVEKLRAFFEQTANSGFINGVSINGSGYDPDDPSTWRSCTWNSDGTLNKLSFSNLGWNVSGSLDLSGCTGLVTLLALDTFISEVDLSGCTALVTCDLTGNRLSSLSVSSCTNLELLWFKENYTITSIDISANAQLRSFDCSNNNISSLVVSNNPLLTVLRCSNNKIESLDVSNCPLLTELNCKSNLLTELDISNLTHLVKLYSFNNRLTSLDLSVLNNGSSYIVDSDGNGYIGTKYYYSTGVNASPTAMDRYIFAGWYMNGQLVSDAENYPCNFGNGEKHITAVFVEATPEPTVVPVTPAPTPVPTPTPVPFLLGDVNGNYQIESMDALIILRYSLGVIEASSFNMVAADVNQDGSVDTYDALLILRYALGLLESF